MKNIGNTDKVVRVIAAVLIVILVLTKTITGTLSIILLIVAGIFLITSFISICPLYLPFGISTRKKQSDS